MRLLSKLLLPLLALSVIGLYGAVSAAFKREQAQMDQKIAVLQKQIASLSDSLYKVTGETAENALSLSEVLQRQKVREKSQEELLTEAVARVAPSVVSIVISKSVPQLEVTYENPFGDDPFFKDVGVRVPVYRQKGTVDQKIGAGTGFIVTGDGYILTNRHVVSDLAATYTVLLANGKQQAASVVYRDPDFDVAVLKIPGAYAPVPLGSSASLKVGQSVIAIGNALGQYDNSVSVGIVSALNRTIEASDEQGNSEILRGVIQTDAAINRGNSGGPLLTMDGKAAGVNVATVVGSNSIGFAIPIDTVRTILGKALGRKF